VRIENGRTAGTNFEANFAKNGIPAAPSKIFNAFKIFFQVLSFAFFVSFVTIESTTNQELEFKIYKEALL